MRSAVLTLILAAAPPKHVEQTAQDALLAQDVTPRDAAYLAAEVVGRPDLGPELERVCMRESRCRPVGPHAIDSWAGLRSYRAAVRKGWLSPSSCPSHKAPSSRADAARWSTRGSYGGIAAFMLHRVEDVTGPCAEPDVLDHPGVAALAAARFAVSCDEFFGHACSCADRTRLWMGPGVWAARSYERRHRAVVRQCGPQASMPAWQVLADALAPTRERVAELVGTIVNLGRQLWAPEDPEEGFA